MSVDQDPQQGGSYLRDPDTGELVPAIPQETADDGDPDTGELVPAIPQETADDGDKE